MKVNKKTLAEILGVSTNTIGKWIANDCPHEREGRGIQFETIDVIQWLYDEKPSLGIVHARNLKNETGEPDERLHYDAEQERARKDSELADKTALENKVRRGELGELGEIEKAWENIALAIRSKLLSLGSKLAPTLAPITKPAIIKKRIDQATREALADLSKNGPSD